MYYVTKFSNCKAPDKILSKPNGCLSQLQELWDLTLTFVHNSEFQLKVGYFSVYFYSHLNQIFSYSS